MMRRAAFSFLIIFGSLLAAWQVAGQGMLTLGAGSAGSAVACTAPSIDGNANAIVNGDWSSGGTYTLAALSTNSTNVVVILTVQSNIFNPTTTTASGSVLGSYTSRVTGGTAATAPITEFFAKSAAAISGEVITVSFTQTPNGFSTANAYAVSGTNFSSPFDPNGSLPTGQTTAPVTISTTNNCTMVIGGSRTATTGTGAGFTTIRSSNFMDTEYQRFTTAQTSLAVGYANNGASNGAYADALTSP